MFLNLLAFELRLHAKSTVFRAAVAVFLLLGLMLSRAQLGGLDIFINAPLNLAYHLGLLSLGTGIVIALLAGGAILRDQEFKMEPIIFCTNISHWQYMISRFTGLVCAAMLAFSASLLGMLIGSLLPWVRPGTLGAFHPGAYIWSLVVIGLPNVLFGCAVIFATAALTRNAMATYISGVFLYILYFLGSILGNSPVMASSTFMGSKETELAILLEPYGLVGMLTQTRYWSLVEKNTLYIALDGAFLLNRLLWTGFALCLFALTYSLFRFRALARTKGKPEPATPTQLSGRTYRPLNPTVQGWQRSLSAFSAQTGIYLKTVMKGFPFLALMLMWTFFTVITQMDNLRRGELNVALLPLTGLMLPNLLDSLFPLGSLVVVFYATELVWFERALAMDGLLDTTPSSNLVFWGGKVAALASLVFCLVGLSILLSILVQSMNGFYAWDLGLYASLFVRVGWPLVLIGVVCMFLQNLVRYKYVGMALGFAFVILGSGVILKKLGPWEHPMLRFAYLPMFEYAPMAGQGFADQAVWWYLVYWTGIGGVVALLSLIFWRRGANLKREKLGGTTWLVGSMCFVAALLSGGYLFYENNIKRPYRTGESLWDWQETYERTYGPFESNAVPSITEMDLKVDLYPEQRSYRIEGRFQLKNTSGEPMARCLMGITPKAFKLNCKVEGGRIVAEPNDYGQYWCTFDKPLADGDVRELTFSFLITTSAFESRDAENYVLAQTSYVEIDKVLPYFGFNWEQTIQSKSRREERGLPKYQEFPEAKEQRSQSEAVQLKVQVSTVADQTIIAPGTQKASWEADGRRFYQFELEGIQPQGFGVASGHYETQTIQVGSVKVRLHLAPGHDQNAGSILKGAKDSLEYYQKNFGPYPTDVLELAEISSFSDLFGGTSYPNTIFLVENRMTLLNQKPGDVDINYLGVAHEISHQWWGAQISPELVEGYRMQTEFLAEYSEMAVYSQTHDQQAVLDYLEQYADVYFWLRGNISEPEQSLVEIQDHNFVYYFKGAHVAYVLKELLGEQAINQVLKQFLKDYKYPNQPRAKDLYERFQAITPEDKKAKVKELMEEVVTYDLSIQEAQANKTSQGETELEIQIAASKTQKEGETETTGALSEQVELAFYQNGKQIHTEQVDLQSKTQTVKIKRAIEPDEIIIDPKRLHLEANYQDNHRKVQTKKE